MEVHHSNGDLTDEVEQWISGLAWPGNPKHSDGVPSESSKIECDEPVASSSRLKLAIMRQVDDPDLGQKRFRAVEGALSKPGIGKVSHMKGVEKS